MKITIYQINDERDKNKVMFIPYDFIAKYQKTQEIQSNIYDKVFDGEVDCDRLENVFDVFNANLPPEFTGRMATVSDIVEIFDDDSEEAAFYFRDISRFIQVEFDPDMTEDRRPENFITALLITPDDAPKEVQIGRDLRSLQKAVKGNIEQFSCFADDATIVCNDEGKFKGLTLCRAVRMEKRRELSYAELKEDFCRRASNGLDSQLGYIVFTEDSFKEPRSPEARTYILSSGNKAFCEDEPIKSMVGSNMDGSDTSVRLDLRMQDEQGGMDGWKIESCYVYEDAEEILDIIAGTFLIVNAPPDSEEYESLTFGQLHKYKRKFKYPEAFMRYGGKIYAMLRR